MPSGFQKEFKETDQRVSLLYNAVEGMSLRIFPIPNHENNKWISAYDYRMNKDLEKKLKTPSTATLLKMVLERI